MALFLLILLISALAQTASLKELSREDWRTPDNSKLAAHLTLRRDAHELFKRKAAQSEEPLEEEVLFCDSVRETIGLLESETQSQILVHTRVEVGGASLEGEGLIMHTCTYTYTHDCRMKM